jgi:hypothetical protein
MQNQKQESPTGKKIITIKLKKQSYNSKRFHPSDNRELLFYLHNAIYLQKEQPVRFSTLSTAGDI